MHAMHVSGQSACQETFCVFLLTVRSVPAALHLILIVFCSSFKVFGPLWAGFSAARLAAVDWVQ